MQIDKGKLKQGTRVALDMTTLTIMRFEIFLYIIFDFVMLTIWYTIKSGFIWALEGYEQGLYGFWKVMEIENAVFQDLESFGKEKIFKMAMERFSIFI